MPLYRSGEFVLPKTSSYNELPIRMTIKACSMQNHGDMEAQRNLIAS